MKMSKKCLMILAAAVMVCGTVSGCGDDVIIDGGYIQNMDEFNGTEQASASDESGENIVASKTDASGTGSYVWTDELRDIEEPSKDTSKASDENIETSAAGSVSTSAPLGSVIVKTYTREDGSTYGVDKLGYYGMSDTAKALSTKRIPSEEDFDWFITDVYKNGPQEGSEYISHPEDVLGDWKCLVIYDPKNDEGKLSHHYGSAHANCRKNKEGEEELNITIEWNYCVDQEGDRTDETGKERFLSLGPFSEDGWYNKNMDRNLWLNMWSYDGTQYAAGSVELQDVKKTYIALVRP